MRETQQSITQWANDTFGPVTDLGRCFERVEKEFDELRDAVEQGDDGPKIVGEAADVVLALYRYVGALGGDLDTEVDRKMAINRGRRWRPDGFGNGQHIKEDGE